jgi:hypothetical protein
MAKTETAETTETLAQGAKEARLAAILADLAAYDDVELPAELQQWLADFGGCLETSLRLDPDTYFSKGWGPYDAVDQPQSGRRRGPVERLP